MKNRKEQAAARAQYWDRIKEAKDLIEKGEA
jgi:hypothetical protein